MGLRTYLVFMTLGTLVCWAVWILVIIGIDPIQTGIFGYVLFYVSLFLSMTGTVSVIGFIVRKKIDKKDIVVFRHVKHTFRQGLIIASLIIISLLMLQNKLLNLMTGLLVVVAFIMIESIFFANRKYKNRDIVS